MGLNLLEKTELWVNEITLANANLSDMADAVAEQLGLDKGKVMVVDVRPRHIDVYKRQVLICGETGTGKELVASSLHNASYRKAKPFVAVNCAALPESILEGLLFGSRKGAFTGAENRKGLFQEADGGTLYLDEINSMPLNLQAKLLRVLQEKQVMPLGSTQPIAVDVRIVSSSNCPPDELVRNGELRPDLLYRLNTVTLAIPPLNQRPDDIPLLSEYFLYKYSRVLGRPVPQMAQETILFLSNCRWHGNCLLYTSSSCPRTPPRTFRTPLIPQWQS